MSFDYILFICIEREEVNMIKDHLNLFYPTTLNVFTDASVKQVGNHEYFTSYGARLMLGYGYLTMSAYTCPGTNNFGEASAIRLGVLNALDALRFLEFDPVCRINLFSDSKINLFGLRDWIYSWLNNQDPNGVLMSSSGTPVANQNILMDTASLILNNNLRICLYHQAGHCTNEKTMIEGKEVFFKSNGIGLANIELLYICENNNIIDDFTRVNLDMNKIRPSNVGFYQIPTKSQMSSYKQLTSKVYTENPPDICYF